MHFDDVLKKVGEFGRYQKIRLFLICLVSMLCAFHAMNMVFVGASPNKSCVVPDYNLTANLTQEEFKDLVTSDTVDEDHLLKKCHMYDGAAIIRYIQLNNLSFTDMKRHIENGAKEIPVQKCTDWDFSKDVYGPTIVTEFLLVCDKAWLRSTSKTLYFAGRLVGAVVFGQLSDIVGRRPMFFTGLLVLLVAGCTAASSPNMYVFVPAYILQGASQTGLFLVAFTMCSEYVGERHRVLATSLMQVFYSFGYMTLSAIAYLIYNWRFIEVAITVPVIFFGFYICFLPESPRWQLSKNKIKEAKSTMQKMAATNRIDIADHVLDQLESVSEEQKVVTNKTFIDLLRPLQMLKLTLNVWFNWLVNSMVYYGLTLGTGYLGGSPYINFMIAGVVELPAFVLCVILLNKFGRKRPLTGMMILSATTCIASGFVPKTKNLVSLKIALAMISKFGITSSYKIVYLMTAEVFPTVVRNIGMGTSSMTARVGGMLAPQVLELRMFWSPLPSIIFGGMTFLAGILALLLPETKGKPLPQTIEDIVHSKNMRNEASETMENIVQIDYKENDMLSDIENTNRPDDKRKQGILETEVEDIIHTSNKEKLHLMLVGDNVNAESHKETQPEPMVDIVHTEGNEKRQSETMVDFSQTDSHEEPEPETNVDIVHTESEKILQPDPKKEIVNTEKRKEQEPMINNDHNDVNEKLQPESKIEIGNTECNEGPEPMENIDTIEGYKLLQPESKEDIAHTETNKPPEPMLDIVHPEGSEKCQPEPMVEIILTNDHTKPQPEPMLDIVNTEGNEKTEPMVIIVHNESKREPGSMVDRV